MKNRKIFTVLLWLVSIVILLSLSACKDNSSKEKQVLTVSGMKAQVDAEIWKSTSDIILKGKVIEVGESYFTNPEGDKMQSDGVTPVLNAYVTEYIVSVEEVYKGEWSAETITIKAHNRAGLNVEQALYGEDEETVVINEIPDVTMTMGECLIGVCLFTEETYGNEPFYELAYGAAGYFLPQEDGSYYNTAQGSNHFSIDPTVLLKDVN